MKSQFFQTVGAVCIFGIALVGTGCGDVSEKVSVPLVRQRQGWMMSSALSMTRWR